MSRGMLKRRAWVGLAGLVATSVAGVAGPQAHAESNQPTLVIGVGTGAPGSPISGPAISSSLNGPTGVAVDDDGNLYIADTNNHVIEKVTPDGTLSIIAGTGTPGGPTPGPATASKLNYPAAVAVDSDGSVYIADEGNNRVEKVTASGILSVIAGTGEYAQVTPGAATSSGMFGPTGVAVDDQGNVYIADSGNCMIEKVTPTNYLTVVAGNGACGAASSGPATSTTLNHPNGVAVDGTGNVYIADTDNHQVEKVTPDRTLSIIAGTGTPGGPTPGRATSSQLNYPVGVAVDGAGNVYIADTANQRIDKVSPIGTLSIVAGTGAAGGASAGPATSSNLNYPFGVSVGTSGTIYIADTDNHQVDIVNTGPALSWIEAPYIIGNGQVGTIERVVPGSTSATVQSFGYQWYADGVAIAGATSRSYKPTAGDVGRVLTATVTGRTYGRMDVTATSDPTDPIARGVLFDKTDPALTGTAKVGKTLSVNPGTWLGQQPTLSYAWTVGGTPVKATTALKLTKTMRKKTVTVTVTAAAPGYNKTTFTLVSTPVT